MGATVKGYIIKGVLSIVKNRKGPSGLIELEKKFGNINFSSIKDYPVEINAALRKAASEVVYGKYSPETEYEFGKVTFITYTENLIGKTMFSLFGNNLKKIALALPKILATINRGLEVKVEDLGPQKIKIVMINDPYDIRYHEGVWAAAVEYFHYQPHVEATVLKPGMYQYILSWNKQE